MEFIDLKKQYRLYKKEIDKAIQQVLDKSNYIMGEPVKELEKALADYVGVKHCIGVSSGTDSLQIALMALGIGAGNEVITTPFTWIATAEAIGLVGAKPRFVDIDPNTFNINPDLIERAITTSTKAIIPVSLFGQMSDCEAINAIASKHGLSVIEDGAQSFGCTQNGKKSCGATFIGSTSFFPAKPFGCYGDGGALFLNDDQLAAKMRAIRTHGEEERHHHPYLGMNGRLDTLQAAILLAKFPFFSEELKAREEIGRNYSKFLKGFCQVPVIKEGNNHIYAQYTIRVPNRDQVAMKLKTMHIPTAIYYPKCLHEQPVFASLGNKLGDFPEAEKASREVLSLPMHPWLTKEDQLKVVEAVINALR